MHSSEQSTKKPTNKQDIKAQKRRSLFITGTDTDVGKTLIASALIYGIKQNAPHLTPIYHKPIQSGGANYDLKEVQKKIEGLKHIPSCYQYQAPLSPDQAAELEKSPSPQLSALCSEFFKILTTTPKDSFLVIEGAGGLQVPINEHGETWIDYLRATDIPTILVARNKLGVINHTSLSIKLLQAEGLNIAGIILSGGDNPKNLESIQRLHRDIPIFSFKELPQDGLAELQKEGESLASFCFTQLDKFRDSSSNSEEMLLTDKKHCWHPYTQHFRQSPPLLLKKAKGIFLELEDGRKIIDGSSSWWVNTIGHGRPEIAAAIKKQQQELDHVIFAGATHEPAIYLAKKIITLADSHLSKVFFSDNGSTAVEVGLKMAFQKFVNRGEFGRTKFLGFKGSYHGDTLGAMSVGKSDGFHGMFKPLLFETIWAEPATMHKSVFCPNGELDLKDKIADLRALLEKHHNELAGIIIEPLVQGAGGMLVQPFSFLEAIQEMAIQFDLPLIFDEVFTGLGRVGASFAFKRANLKPDIVCIAKGLTGGNLPLALTLTHDGIFEHFLDGSKTKALLHGHSYTANPISCSAALATLDIVHNENLIEKSQDIEKHFSSWLSSEGKKLNLENPRCIGAILAFELPGSGFGDYFSHRANNFTRIALKNGLMLRTLGNTVYFVPPLIISKDECTYALTQISHTLQELHKEAR